MSLLVIHFPSKAELNSIWGNVGYSYSIENKSLLDVGLRYYSVSNDPQFILSFWGMNTGLKISLTNTNLRLAPYLGILGQSFPFAYGIKTEYLINKKKNNLALTPEIGLSIADIIRITIEYRQKLIRDQQLSSQNVSFNFSFSIPLHEF